MSDFAFLGDNPAVRDVDDELRELQERQHLILEMHETPGWELWKDFVSAVAEGYQNRLLRGKHADMLAYKYDAGVVEGIRIALGASDTLASMVAAQKDVLALTLANQEEIDD